jgi:hypothetical protein
MISRLRFGSLNHVRGTVNPQQPDADPLML